MMSGGRYDRGRDMLYDSSYLALIYPIGHGALANADDSTVVSDVLCKTLGQNRPELFSVLRAAFGNAELIADALGNVTGTVVLAELIVKIADSAREAYKLIAVKLAFPRTRTEQHPQRRRYAQRPREVRHTQTAD